MSVLGFGALFAGVIQIPGVDDVVHQFLDGSFEDSPLYEFEVPDSARLRRAGGRRPDRDRRDRDRLLLLPRTSQGITASLSGRCARVHNFLANKWYFDELIDFLIVRPLLAARALVQQRLRALRRPGHGRRDHRSGPRGANAGVRTAQSGYLRSYALLLVTGFAGLGLYFLVAGT